MGDQEAQAQVKKNSPRSGLNRAMASALRNVFCPPSGTNGIRPENRIQQADSQTGRQRDRRNPQRRISTIWTNQNGIRGYSRDYSGACQKARGTEVSVQGISCWRSSQARTIGPLVETRSLVNLVRRTDPDGSSLES